MSAKAIILCASALLVQTVTGQCLNNYNFGGKNCGCGSSGLGSNGISTSGISTSGGSFPVTSVSPIAPTGLTVVSDNGIEGALSVNGQLPLLSVVALEGSLPTGGQAGVTYGCGDGNIGITAVNNNVVNSNVGYGFPATTGLGCGTVTPTPCGCGVYY